MSEMTKRGAPESEFSEPFVDAMRDRMAVSFFKYGPVEKAKGRVDEVASLKARLKRYEDTGNTEWLVDVANYAMIEFMQPSHPLAHFRATDSHESPGNASIDGHLDARKNTDRPTAADFEALSP